MTGISRQTAMVVFVAIVAVLNIAHPFLHAFEGGGLDAILAQVDAFAAYLSTQRAD